jgi:ArsR family transcriptional regulator
MNKSTPPNPVQVFEALGNSTRLQMLEIMASHKEICVCELVQMTGLSQSGISSHLTVLRRAGIVQSRKEGLWVFYAVDLDALRQAFASVDADLARRLELSANEDPHARLREKVEKGICCPTSASKLTGTLPVPSSPA